MTRIVSPRYSISYPSPTLRDEPADGPGDTKKLVDAIENSVMYGGQGTYATMPAFGIQGRIYKTTDNKGIFYDTGTAWELITGTSSGTALPTNPANGQQHHLRVGSSPYDFILMTYNATYAKWVSPTITEAIISTSMAIANGAAYVALNQGDTYIRNFKGFYDAGLRPQFAIEATLIGSLVGTVIRLAPVLTQFTNGDGLPLDVLLAGADGNALSKTGNGQSFEALDWVQPAITAPTKTNAFLQLASKTPSGTGSLYSARCQVRFVA